MLQPNDNTKNTTAQVERMTQQLNAIHSYFENNTSEDSKIFMFNLLDMAIQSPTFAGLEPNLRSDCLTNTRELIQLLEKLEPNA